MYRVLFVCHGNICRSPMAEFIMKDLVEKNKVAHLFHIESCACHTDALRCRPHRGTRKKLKEVGISTEGKVARLVCYDDYENFDYIIVDKAMEEYKDVSQYTLTKKVSEELRKLETLENFLMLVKYENRVVGKTMCNTGDLAGRLALYFGGGGHKTEGGFTIKNMTIGEILEATKKFIANEDLNNEAN